MLLVIKAALINRFIGCHSSSSLGSSFLSTLNVLELDCGCLLFQMPIDSDHLSKVAEEGIDFDVSELFLGHVLYINGESPRIADHIGLLLGFSAAAIWSTAAVGSVTAHH